jgi:ribosome-binding protein aMBF1 (putative translation factor)
MHASTYRDPRQEMGMSREALADALGEPVRYIIARETGRVRIRGNEAVGINPLLRQHLRRQRAAQSKRPEAAAVQP